MGCIGLLLAILGIFGYANQIWWLFYLAGGIAAIFDILALIRDCRLILPYRPA